jgi:hypothetical protein
VKRFSELKYAEIVALSEKDIDKFIQIEIAEAGIAFVDRPVEPVYDPTAPEKTVIAHEIAGIYFLDRYQAERLLEMDIYDDAYEYSLGGYDRKFLKKVDLSIETKKFFRKEDLEDNRGVLAANAEKKKHYDEQLKIYNAFLEATGRFEKEVYAHYWYILRLQREINEAYRRLACYLTLAEENREIAANFFRKAYPNWLTRVVIDNDDIDKVIEEEAP